MKRRDFLTLGVAALTAPAMGKAAFGQSRYPDRPIRLVIPYPPGGVYDFDRTTLGGSGEIAPGHDRHREHRRRRQLARHRGGRARQTGRLHHPAGRQFRPGDQSDRVDRARRTIR